MFFYLLLLFTVIPLVELAILIWIGNQTSLMFTIGLVLTTGLIGAALARWQGIYTALKIRLDLAAGKMPTDAVLDGLMIVVAGALLITPGLLTDLSGFALLVPPVRRMLRDRLKRWFAGRVHFQTAQFSDGAWTTQQDDVVEGEVVSRRVTELPPS
jgi:UPF0716 protein FxsA